MQCLQCAKSLSHRYDTIDKVSHYQNIPQSKYLTVKLSHSRNIMHQQHIMHEIIQNNTATKINLRKQDLQIGLTQRWLSVIRPSRLSAQSTDARSPDTTSRRKRHHTPQTQATDKQQRLSSATSRTWRSDLDNFHGHTYSSSNSSVD